MHLSGVYTTFACSVRLEHHRSIFLTRVGEPWGMATFPARNGKMLFSSGGLIILFSYTEGYPSRLETKTSMSRKRAIRNSKTRVCTCESEEFAYIRYAVRHRCIRMDAASLPLNTCKRMAQHMSSNTGHGLPSTSRHWALATHISKGRTATSHDYSRSHVRCHYH